MPLTRKAKMTLRIVVIVATSFITASVSIIGAIVAAQGGNFWPWVWAMCVLYAVELTYTTIATVVHYRSPEEKRKRDFYRRRRQEKRQTIYPTS